jgi:predicted nucleic acid-binding protein
VPISQLLIETDVLSDYLTTPEGETSLLRLALQRASCYTTMINALELFRAASTTLQHDAVLSMFYLVRVLGFNPRYAEPFAASAREVEATKNLTISARESLILGMAQVSKLSILTRSYAERYAKIGIVPVIRELPMEPSMAFQPFSV